MYGIVFLAVKEWIPLQSAKAEWGLVASRASVPDDYVAKQLYEEVAFFRLIKACTEVLGMKTEDVFEGVGLRCSVLLMKEGNDHLLRVHKGSDVDVFLSYFKPLCGHLTGTTPNIELVSQKSNSSRVHFTPGRWPSGSSHFFIGVLKGLAGELCRGKDFVTRSYPNKDDREDHIFSWSPPSTTPDSCSQDAGPKEGMSVRYFSRLHPFHIMFDRDCNIIQTGPSLQKLIKAETGSHMSKYFTVKAPADTSFSSFRSILYQRQASLFTVSFKRTPDHSVDLLGQMIYLTSRSIMCFVCTPVIASAEEFKALEIQKSDFSLLEAAHLPFSFPGEHSTTSSDGEVAAVPEETAEAPAPADSADAKEKEVSSSSAQMSLSGDAVNVRGEKKGLFKSIFQGSRQERDKLQRDDREKLPNAGQQLPQQPQTQPQPQPQPQQSAQQQPTQQPQPQPATVAELQEKRPAKSKEQALRDEEMSTDSKRRLTKTGSLPDVKISYQDTSSGENAAIPEASGGEEGKKENAVPPQSQQRKSKRGFYFLSSSVAGASSLSSARDASSSQPPVACDDSGVSLRGEKPRQTDTKENSKKRANSGSKIQQQTKSGSLPQPPPPPQPDSLPETLIPIPTQSYYHSYFHQNRILHSFIELLLEDSWDSKFVLTKAIMQTGLQQEESVRTQLFEAVSVFYSSMGKFPLLLAALIEDDLSATPKSDEIESQVVFREESAGVRLFVTFLNLEASYYLQHCIGPLMEAVHTLNKPLELNPLRVSDAECAANAAQLLEMCQSFVAHVCRSSDYCPPTVRRAFHVISMEVARRLPAMYLQSIANLLFLRFLSPALVTPKHGQSRTPAEQRTLTLVAKAVYNLMNNIPFGEKEPYMTPMNAFISTYNVNVVQQFMRDLVDEEKLARVIGHKARTSGRTINDMATVQLKSLTSLNNIKKALLAFLPQLWTASFTNPELQKKLQRILSVSLCDIVTEMVPC